MVDVWRTKTVMLPQPGPHSRPRLLHLREPLHHGPRPLAAGTVSCFRGPTSNATRSLTTTLFTALGYEAKHSDPDLPNPENMHPRRSSSFVILAVARTLLF